MQNERNWQHFFRFAAIFNFAAALMLLFATEQFFALLMMSSLHIAEAVPWVHQFAVLVLVFGMGYWRVAGKPQDHRDIIWMGCIGKVLVFSAAWFDSLSIPALLPFAIFVVADLAFAAAYGVYLMRNAKQQMAR